MNPDLKRYIEDNFDRLVQLYNRYARFKTRTHSTLEYYASPFMNLTGYPSDSFIHFAALHYNKHHDDVITFTKTGESIFKNIYLYFKLLFLFIFGTLFFSRKIDENSAVIHAFHEDKNFNTFPYRTVKTPPTAQLPGKKIYHDLNLSFVSLKSLLKYRKNDITCSIIHLNAKKLWSLHFLALKVYLRSTKNGFLDPSFTTILYTLVKGVSIANLANSLDPKSLYINMWEKRGYQYITDYYLRSSTNHLFLNLGVNFRLSPEYMMFRYTKHSLQSKIFFMCEYNYALVGTQLGDIDYRLFKNYRLDCHDYASETHNARGILLLGPLSLKATERLYELLQEGKEQLIPIKIRLHPYLQYKMDKNLIENRGIYDCLKDYDIIVYTGITTAAVELYFQGKKVYKLKSDSLIDIDLLIDEKLCGFIESIHDITLSSTRIQQEKKNYYLGCDNQEFKEIIEEFYS